MSYPKGQHQEYAVYQQSSNSPNNEYGEEYAYEEYVHGDGRPSGYKREVRYVKDSGNPRQQIYNYEEQKIERPKTNNVKVTKQVTTTITMTNDKKNTNKNNYRANNVNNVYEVQEFQKPQQNGKTVRKAYACSPIVSAPSRYLEHNRVNSGGKYQYQSSYNSSYSINKNQNNYNQPKSRTKNVKSNSPQERSHNVYVSGSNLNNNTRNKQQYKYQSTYQSSVTSKMNKNNSLRQVNNYKNNNQNDQQRKTEVIKANKHIKKTYNDSYNPNQPQTSLATNNHNVYEVKEVTKEARTVEKDPNNININYHRYSYGKYNPNISNTVSHSINETRKEPKQQVVINPRKQEVIKAVKHYRKTYNNSLDNNSNNSFPRNLNSNNSFTGREYKYTFNQNQNQRGKSNNNYARSLKNYNSNSSFNRNKNNSVTNKHYVYTSTSTTTKTNTNNYPDRQYNNKSPNTKNVSLRGYNKNYNQNLDNAIIRDENMPNQKVHSIVYSKRSPNKNTSFNSKAFTKITTTTKTGNNNRGYIVSETQKVTKTTAKDGKTRQYVEARKEEKYEDDPNLRDEVVNYGQGGEDEVGYEYGQEEEEGEES